MSADAEHTHKHKHVLIATPCYGGAVTMAYHLSVIRLLAEVAEKRPDVTVASFLLGNESLVTRARNTCVAYFLANTQYTHLFFVDADIDFSPQTFLRVLDSGKDVAAAVYPQKGIYWDRVASACASRAAEGKPMPTAEELSKAGLNYNVNIHAGEGVRTLHHEDGFLPVDYCATGFLAIRRCVFDVLRAAYPEQQYSNVTLSDASMHPHNWLFFDCVTDPVTKQYLSEDYAFCKKWREAGGRIWADMTSSLGHVGTYKFEGGSFTTTLA